ncbi:MAG: hypothetical protein FJ090_12770 [Deltaproteobacteria bacterium]|nr:hypothetical protein [Deltaproteobacteria bacterium]
MSNKLPLLLALFGLVACDEPITKVAVPDSQPALQNGVYVVSVEKIIELDCDASAREISKWEASLGLAIKGQEARGRLDGIELQGQAKGALVYLDGEIPSGEEPGRRPQDGADRGGQDVDEDEEASEKCEVEDVEDVPVDEPSRVAAVSLDLEASSRREAGGVFLVDVPGCFAELKVRAVYERALDDGSEFTEVEEEIEPEEEEPCGRGEDCG